MKNQEPDRNRILRTREQLALRGIPLSSTRNQIRDEYAHRESVVRSVQSLFEHILHIAVVEDERLPCAPDSSPQVQMAQAYIQMGLVKEAANLGLFPQPPTKHQFWRLERQTVYEILAERLLGDPFFGDQESGAQALRSLGIVATDEFFTQMNFNDSSTT